MKNTDAVSCPRKAGRLKRCSQAGKKTARSDGHDFVVAVECRHAIAFGEGGIVEGVLDEEIDFPPESHHGLTDVDQLRGALADGVDAQQTARLLVEEQFKHSDLVPENLAARDFAVAGDADLVRGAFLN